MRKAFSLGVDFLVASVAGVFLWSFASQKLSRPSSRGEPVVGTSIGDLGIDWQRAHVNLVFLLNRDCKFCTLTAPLYQRIISQYRSRSDVEFVALFPHEARSGRTYLENVALDIQHVRGPVVLPWGGYLTPTLLLCDRDGRVKRFWKGSLTEAVKQDIVRGIDAYLGEAVPNSAGATSH